MPHVTSGIVGPARLSQQEVNYRGGEKCALCTFFYPLNSCEIVEGNISAEGLCDRFQIRRDKPNEGKDGTFFAMEFEEKQRRNALKNPIPLEVKRA